MKEMTTPIKVEEQRKATEQKIKKELIIETKEKKEITISSRDIEYFD